MENKYGQRNFYNTIVLRGFAERIFWFIHRDGQKSTIQGLLWKVPSIFIENITGWCFLSRAKCVGAEGNSNAAECHLLQLEMPTSVIVLIGLKWRFA